MNMHNMRLRDYPNVCFTDVQTQRFCLFESNCVPPKCKRTAVWVLGLPCPLRFYSDLKILEGSDSGSMYTH